MVDRSSTPSTLTSAVTDNPHSAASPRMRRQRERNTGPELALRRRLTRAGLRYRIHYRPLPGLVREADIAFPGLRVAVFVDGCFWHGCSEHRSLPRSNADFWLAKITKNGLRDRDTDNLLGQSGWQVLRLWEHLTEEQMAEKVIRLVVDRRQQRLPSQV